MRKVDPIKHEEKRRDILDAAERCFARDGLQGATVATICAEARISPGHLYHYFSSKEAIIAAIIEASLEHAADRFGRMTESPNAIAAFVTEVKREKMRPKSKGHDLILDMLAEAGRNPAVGKILRKHSHSLRTLLADYLRKGQNKGQVDRSLDPDMTAAILLSIVDGSKTLTIRDPKLDIKRAILLFKTLISRFLAPPPEA